MSLVTLIKRLQDIMRKKVLKLLLDTYAESSFKSLREVKEIFSMPKFKEIGLTTIESYETSFFCGKEKCFEVFKGLENKLYE